MASSTWWTWVWVNSRSWWWTGRPDVLQSMGWQSRTWLSNWTELNWTQDYSHIYISKLDLSWELFCALDLDQLWDTQGFRIIFRLSVSLVNLITQLPPPSPECLQPSPLSMFSFSEWKITYWATWKLRAHIWHLPLIDPQGVLPMFCFKCSLNPFILSISSITACLPAKSLQWCLTLCFPMDCSPPAFCVHGILQARILEWVAMPLL